ncbi:ATP-dependent DNA ligase [Candidatus Dependentiae bacterium Noda2021]|nr:ATP-dependent DNA ligase [Candidatus Dependentiae bacterium Noda2021]
MKKNNALLLLSPDLRKKIKKVSQPHFIKPMLATLTKTYFASDDWIFEHKFDGVRCVVIKKGTDVKLFSRNENLLNVEYPEIVKALEKQKATNFVVDGEIIAVNKKGVSDFQMLQSRMNLKDHHRITEHTKLLPVSIHIFDVMYVDGYDVTHLPLLDRKKILKKLLSYNATIQCTEFKSGNGIAMYKRACKNKWEGLIAKKSDSIYELRRSKNWLKFKCAQGQELVIAGFSDSRGQRTDFGALLVGYYKDGALQYAGKVGTGFSQETLTMLGKKMRALEIKKCPFADYDGPTTGIHWIKPKLVAEFQFAQWTNAGKLRVGRYKGLREDKKAHEVIREVAKI